MRVWAVTTVRDEVDIIGHTIAHLLAEGVEHIFVYDGMSIDGTRDVLAGFNQVTVFDDHERYHLQPKRMTELAELAYANGAEWIIPFDADEWWCSTTPGHRLVDTFAALPNTITRAYASMWQHRNWEWREPMPKPLCKVAFRWQDGAKLHNGNHDVDGVGGQIINNALQVREIQYRGFDHFIEKIKARCATLDPALPESHGGHHKNLAKLTPDELRREWLAMGERATVNDPIPSRCPPFVQS